MTIDELEKSKELVTQLRVERDAVGGEMDKLSGEIARLRTGSQPPGRSARQGDTGRVTSAEVTWVKHCVEPRPVELRPDATVFAPTMAARLPFELGSGLVSSTLPASVISSNTLPRRGSISGTSSGSGPVSGKLRQSSGVCSASECSREKWVTKH